MNTETGELKHFENDIAREGFFNSLKSEEKKKWHKLDNYSESCPNCRGYGWKGVNKDGKYKPCKTCGGKGDVKNDTNL